MSNIDHMRYDNLQDPVFRGLVRNHTFMRTYQGRALRTIYRAAMDGNGGRFTVTFPRQSGKNETQAQLESAVMAANLHKGGTIIKILPTEKNQGRISRQRLETVLLGDQGLPPGAEDSSLPSRALNTSRRQNAGISIRKDGICYGNTSVRCLSASPNAAIVGATADLLLEVDEAQMVPADKFDREAAPMAAAANAVQVFWGTVWDDQTLLARETRLALREEAEGSRAFQTTASEVGDEVPAYREFVSGQVKLLGREHPAIRTQFFCEEISDLTSMFTPERIEKMKGSHDPLYGPEQYHCYVFLIDIAGSDEITPKEKRGTGFSDRRDATVLTICDVSLPDDLDYDAKNFIWKVAARRLYRNVTAEQLEREICREVEAWDPWKIILDHTGLGSLLSGYLGSKYPAKTYPVDITAANKTKMAWDFLAMVNAGRWQEYRCGEERVLNSGFRPGRDIAEILDDPAMLQQQFFRELRACRIEPMSGGLTVRWGVKEGTRDHGTGRLIHDDLVMSAALAVFEDGDLPLGNMHVIWNPPPVIDPITGRPFPPDYWKRF